MSTSSSDEVSLPGAPAVPGLVFRPFRDPSDYARMAEIATHTFPADSIDVLMTAEEHAAQFAATSTFDPQRSILLAEVNWEPVAVAWVIPGRLYGDIYVCGFQGRVHPDWRGLGIGRALLHWNECLAREFATAAATAVPRFFITSAQDSAPRAVALLCSEGYAPVRAYYLMTRPLEDDLTAGVLPPGIDVRPVEPEHYRAIWDAQNEAFRGSWGYPEMTDEDYQTFFLGDANFDPTLWRVAWEGDEVVGMVRSYINAGENAALGRRRGYTEWISVRAPWRGRGIARALLCQSLQSVRDRGMAEAALNVDTENASGALALYESCGFAVRTCRRDYRKAM